MKLFCSRIALLVLFITGASVTAASALTVDEIKFVGAQPEQVESLKNLSGFLPGDEFESQRLNRSIEKLKEHLEAKGYPQAQITAEILKGVADPMAASGRKSEKNVLTFQLILGEPVRISEVSFANKEGVISPEIIEKLLKVVALQPGEIFDRERIKEMKRVIETALTALNFVDSHVTEVATYPVNGGLRVNFEIEFGQKVIFSVYGNSYFTRTELMDLIVDQQNQGLGRDYINVILNRLVDRYVEHGFKFVKITPYTFEQPNEPRKVAYEIEEGSKVLLKNIFFDGNEAFSDAELESLFFKSAPERIQARIYSEALIESSAKSMIEELKKRGFLSAKLIAIKTVDSELPNEVDVRFFLHEGLQTRVQSITFKGNQVFDSKALSEFLGFNPGDPLNLVQLEDGLDRIKREYRNHAYLDVRIVNEGAQLVTYSEKNQNADLSIEIAEGSEIRYGGFRIFGNEKTRAEVISREIQIRTDEPLVENKLIETEDRLRRLGIFSQVNIELQNDSEKPLSRNMKISVQEAIPGNMGAGVGFRNDLGVRVFSEISYSNLWGMNHGWVLNVSGNRRLSTYRFFEFAAQASYIWPWFVFGETTMRPSLTAEKRQYREFDAETFALSDSFERMLYKPIKLSGSLTYTIEKIRQFNSADALDNQQVTIGSVTPLLRIDLRDNPLAPRRGLFAITSFEYANAALGAQVDPVPVSYGRFQARTDVYLDFIPRIIWYSSFRGGYLRNYVNPVDANGNNDPRIQIPLIKQFTLGGVNSLRGFNEQELNVQANDVNKRVQGYMTYVNYRTQLDFLLSQSLTIGPFFDAGNLQVDAFSLGNLRYGTGLGLRYLTPVGPVNFDWGFKLFPRPNEDNNVFYFSLGVI